MAKRVHPQIVTANDLLDGDVVWLDEAGGWTRNLRDAAVARDQETAAALLDAARAQWRRVVGAELAEVALGPGGPRPLHFREAFRARGPSHRPDLGRQAERPDVSL